jgi:hypothetical protein
MEITVQLVLFVLIVSFLAGFGWAFGHALAAWLMHRGS